MQECLPNRHEDQSLAQTNKSMPWNLVWHGEMVTPETIRKESQHTTPGSPDQYTRDTLHLDLW